MTYGKLFATVASAGFTIGILVVAAAAGCAQLSAKLLDGQPAHAQDLIDYISACPNFTGNVGIGTAAPAWKLDVVKGTDATDGIRISGSIDTRLTIGAGQPSVWSWANGWMKAGDFSLIEEGVSGSRIYVKPGGNVGIGTTSPGYLLVVTGTVQAANLAPNSDRRLKSDIKPLNTGAITSILALRPVTFRWKTPKDDGMAGIQTGLIAQDVESVLPTAVITAHDAIETKSIKYNELTAILIKAVQEQQRELATLRAENVGLRRDHATVQHQAKQITDLTARLDRLERMRVAKIQ